MRDAAYLFQIFEHNISKLQKRKLGQVFDQVERLRPDPARPSELEMKLEKAARIQKAKLECQARRERRMALGLALLFCCGPAWANHLTLAWDASPDLNVRQYFIYAMTNAPGSNYLGFSGQALAVRMEVGTNLTAQVSELQAGRWSFVATAGAPVVDGTNSWTIESLPSNMVTVAVPAAPPRMMTVVLEYSGNSITNFYDVGFFRLRLP